MRQVRLGIVLKAHRLLYHPTSGSRVTEKKKMQVPAAERRGNDFHGLKDFHLKARNRICLTCAIFARGVPERGLHHLRYRPVRCGVPRLLRGPRHRRVVPYDDSTTCKRPARTSCGYYLVFIWKGLWFDFTYFLSFRHDVRHVTPGLLWSR